MVETYYFLFAVFMQQLKLNSFLNERCLPRKSSVFAGAMAFGSAYFGQGSGPIFMDVVACDSNDTALLACSYDPNTSEDSHAEDAGVRCGGECFSTFTPVDGTLAMLCA